MTEWLIWLYRHWNIASLSERINSALFMFAGAIGKAVRAQHAFFVPSVDSPRCFWNNYGWAAAAILCTHTCEPSSNFQANRVRRITIWTLAGNFVSVAFANNCDWNTFVCISFLVRTLCHVFVISKDKIIAKWKNKKSYLSRIISGRCKKLICFSTGTYYTWCASFLAYFVEDSSPFLIRIFLDKLCQPESNFTCTRHSG